MLLSFADVMSFLATQLDTILSGSLEQRVRNAVQMAWGRMHTLASWSYFHRSGVLRVYPGQNTGTVSFSKNTGLVTLTGNTFPETASTQHILIDRTWYPIFRRLSSTQVELYPETRPAVDLTDVRYVLQQVLYPLPAEVSDVVVVYEGHQNIRMWRVSPTTAFQIQEGFSWSPTLPTQYSIFADPRHPGRWCLWIPCEIYTPTELAYMYQARRPSQLLVRESRGTVSVADGIATFSDPIVTPAFVGAVLRLSASATTPPVGSYGDYAQDPSATETPVSEMLVTAFLSSTQVRVSDTTASASGVAYVASTHIDCAGGAMQSLVFRLAEDEYGTRPVGNHNEKLVSKSNLADAVREALAADNRNVTNMRSELQYWYGLRLKDIGYVVS